jgi:hypothetical protein
LLCGCRDGKGEADTSVAVLVEGTELVKVLSKPLVALVEVTAELMSGPVDEVIELKVFPGKIPELEKVWKLDVLAVGPEFAVGDTVAEVTATAKSKALPAELQQLPLPFASQQNLPSSMVELWHWTTNLLAPISPVSEYPRRKDGRERYPCRMKGR